ncbi:chemotaxis protein CheA [Corallococcus sp. H22C18031201]|nr:chemotaxis protein CheA [Corallococcus sp. H22C18031201]
MEVDRHLLLSIFVVEADEQLGGIEEGLLELESNPDSPGTLKRLFRLIHTLKGTANSLGFVQLSEFAHVVESLMDRLRQRTLVITPDRVSLLLRAVDSLRALMPSPTGESGDVPPTVNAVLDLLATDIASAAEHAARPDDLSDDENPTPAEPARETPPGDPATHTLRVDVRRLDRLLDLAGELTIARERLGRLLHKLEGAEAASLREASWEVDLVSQELQEQVMQLRMVPLAPTLRPYARTVRDVAASLGKRARLDVQAGDVELDTRLVEQLRAPLTHLIRNALDHGIELPEERVARGKEPCGQLVLRALHDAGATVLELSDDGAGLDRAAIEQRAREQRLASRPELLDDAALYALIFEPGFTTTQAVTEYSGRGVGLDVVRRTVEALRGSVAVRSAPGAGTTFTLRLPLTLAIIDGFLVRAGEETYVLPLDTVTECLELPTGQSTGAERGMLHLRDRALPYVRARDLFGVSAPPAPRENVVVLQHAGGQLGLAVDALLGTQPVVLKPLGTVFQGLPGLAGSSVLGDGRVALILDIPGLLRLAHQRKSVSAPLSSDLPPVPLT